MIDREATQLLSLASHYIRLARFAVERVEDKSITSGQVDEQSVKYNTEGSVSPEDEVFSHIASAAIRLATIAEKYPKKNFGKNYRELKDKSNNDAEKEILSNLSQYIHYLFRDNVSHNEEEENERFARYAEIRKRVIPKISIDRTYSAADQLLRQIANELIREGIVVDC